MEGEKFGKFAIMMSGAPFLRDMLVSLRSGRLWLKAMAVTMVVALSVATATEMYAAPSPASQSQSGKSTTKKKTTSKKNSAPAKKKAAPKAQPKKTSRKKAPAKKKPKAPVRTSKDVKREQQATAKDIKETSAKLDENRKSTAAQLNRLNDLRSRIEQQTSVIASTQADANAISSRIEMLDDTIKEMREHVEKLRESYGKILRRSQGTERRIDHLSFVFAAESFQEAVQRMRYLRQISHWRRQKQQELQTAVEALHSRQTDMAELLRQKNAHIVRLNTAKASVEKDSKETSQIVARLKQEGVQLQAHLARQQQKLQKLDRELDRLIAAEQRRIEQERLRREKAERERQERERQRQERAARNQQQSGGGKASGDNQSGKSKRKPAKSTESDVRQAAPITASASVSQFARMKGRLPFPVEGKYRVISAFGRHPHPDFPNIEVQNSGIDIEMLSSNRRARAIADGTVSAVFNQPGYNNIVMIRHGEYITIYAGISNLSIKTGDTVRTGQTIGQVQPDPDNDGRHVLHFELRHEREKLNPLQWVR